jgi:hypothetical protein
MLQHETFGKVRPFPKYTSPATDNWYKGFLKLSRYQELPHSCRKPIKIAPSVRQSECSKSRTAVRLFIKCTGEFIHTHTRKHACTQSADDNKRSCHLLTSATRTTSHPCQTLTAQLNAPLPPLFDTTTETLPVSGKFRLRIKLECNKASPERYIIELWEPVWTTLKSG